MIHMLIIYLEQKPLSTASGYNRMPVRNVIEWHLAFYESKWPWVILLFLHQNENDGMSLVQFLLFVSFLTNHNVMLYTCNTTNQNSVDSETRSTGKFWKISLNSMLAVKSVRKYYRKKYKQTGKNILSTGNYILKVL